MPGADVTSLCQWHGGGWWERRPIWWGWDSSSLSQGTGCNFPSSFSLNPPPTTRLSVASLFSQPPSGPLWSRERLPNCQVNDLPQAPLPTLQSPLDLTLVSPGNSSRPCPLPVLELPPASPGWGRAWAGRVDGRPQQPSLAPLGTLRTQRGTQTWVGWACARKASCRR